MKSSYIVAQGNELIEARHNNPLTAREQKIILTMVSMIQPTDIDFKDYQISIKEFSEMLGLKGSAKYTEIKEITKGLMAKSIEIPRENGGWLLAHWISSAEYIEGEGIIALSFSPKLKPYLLQLKQYTSYRLSNILSLSSSYSIRLYEIMRKWSFTGKWELSIEEMREKLGAMTKSYSIYGNFKSKVLIPAIDEINMHTDIFISYKEIKKGRKVDRIEFSIKPSRKAIHMDQPNLAADNPLENEDVRQRLNELTNGYQFERSYFEMIYQYALLTWQDAAEREMEMLIRYINENKSIHNPLGFIMSQLKSAFTEHEKGSSVTFATLQSTQRQPNGYQEKVPEWFNKEVEDDDVWDIDMVEKREELKRKLALLNS